MEWKPILKFYEQFDNYHIVNVDFTVIYCKICFYTHPVSANLQYDIILYLLVHFEPALILCLVKNIL